MPRPLRQDWIDNAREAGKNDAACAATLDPSTRMAWLIGRHAYLWESYYARQVQDGTLYDADRLKLMEAWRQGAQLVLWTGIGTRVDVWTRANGEERLTRCIVVGYGINGETFAAIVNVDGPDLRLGRTVTARPDAGGALREI